MLYLLPTTAGGDIPDELMQVMVPLLDIETCNQPAWHDGMMDDSMVCAGFEEGGFGTCHVSFHLLCLFALYDMTTRSIHSLHWSGVRVS